jgi:hypothetical protein
VFSNGSVQLSVSRVKGVGPGLSNLFNVQEFSHSLGITRLLARVRFINSYFECWFSIRKYVLVPLRTLRFDNLGLVLAK